ncbi:unnamed protein product [Closterium sp. NIES-54]
MTTASPPVTASSQVFAATSRSSPASAPCLSRPLSHETLLWHHRLGHPSLPRLRGMASRALVSGLPRAGSAAPHSSTFPLIEAPLQNLHMDVWGPARVCGQGHERYFLLVVDDYSRYTTVFFLRSKGDVIEVLIDWIRGARRQLSESFDSDLPVLRLHSDRGGEFSSDLLRAFCRAEGIHQTFTLPASPQQNGIAERRIGMVMDVARTSMIHAAAPHFLWPIAVQYAAHQINLQPRVSLPETTPTLRWTGKVGDASVFRVWGSQAFVRDTSADKLSSRAIPCVFLGFPPDAPGWQFYHPTSRRVLSSQDVMFDKSVSYYRLFPYRAASLPPPPLFVAPGAPPVDPLPPQGPAPSGVSQVDPAKPVEVAVHSGAARGAEPAGAGTGGAEPGGAELERVEPGGAESGGADSGGAEPERVEPGGAEPGGTASGGAEPAWLSLELCDWYAWRYRRATGAAGAGGAGAARGATGAGAAGGAAGAGAARGASGAVGAAGAGGAASVGAAGTGAGGAVGVVAGDPRAEGTGAVSAISGGNRGSLLPSLAGSHGCRDGFLEVHRHLRRRGSPTWGEHRHWPVDLLGEAAAGFSACLQGALRCTWLHMHEEIWLRRPPGFTGLFPAGTHWSLRRPVYDLRQAPREWHDTLRTTLATLGFAPFTADPSLFLRTDTTLLPFNVLVYVDDLLLATADTEALAHVKSELQKRHTCTNLDLAYPLTLLARYVAPDRHRKVHWDAAKRVLRCLCSTSGMGLVLGGRARVVLTGHADASWVDDLAMQRSSQGFTFSLGSNSVSWQSTRSSSVFSSSCEAEIYAGAMAAQELRWLTCLLTDLGEAPCSPPVLYVDNKAMLALC